MDSFITIDSNSLPEETELVKLIASELIRQGVPRVSFASVLGRGFIDQSDLSDIDASRIVSPTTIRLDPM